jgi:C1A family cysteine protease
LPGVKAPPGDYHAVVVVGASDHPTKGFRRLLIRNSWGSGWGAAGYAWLPTNYLISFGAEAAVVGPGLVP